LNDENGRVAAQLIRTGQTGNDKKKDAFKLSKILGPPWDQRIFLYRWTTQLLSNTCGKKPSTPSDRGQPGGHQPSTILITHTCGKF